MITVDDIKQEVAVRMGVEVFTLNWQDRCRRYCRPRQIAMYLTRTLLGMSYPKIGAHFGGRDHTTVLHSVRVIRNMMGKFGKTAELVLDLVDRLRVKAGVS